jgi:hypothetical protein
MYNKVSMIGNSRNMERIWDHSLINPCGLTSCQNIFQNNSIQCKKY